MIKTPFVTVDIIISYRGGVVLVERKNEPQGWALPGGFVDIGESVQEAAVREAKEETSLDVLLTDLFYVYSDPNRDPRFHTVSIVFMGGGAGELRGADDARRAEVFTEQNLPDPIVFDHRQIIDDYFAYLVTGQRPAIRPR